MAWRSSDWRSISSGSPSSCGRSRAGAGAALAGRSSSMRLRDSRQAPRIVARDPSRSIVATRAAGVVRAESKLTTASPRAMLTSAERTPGVRRSITAIVRSQLSQDIPWMASTTRCVPMGSPASAARGAAESGAAVLPAAAAGLASLPEDSSPVAAQAVAPTSRLAAAADRRQTRPIMWDRADIRARSAPESASIVI